MRHSREFENFISAFHDVCWGLVKRAKEPTQLIGLGEVLEAIQSSNYRRDDYSPPILIVMELGCPDGGMTWGVTVDETGIFLDRTYSGSDHFTIDSARAFWSDQSVRGSEGIFEWSVGLESVMRSEDFRIFLSRNHAE
jgi:hypothetical protein